MNQPKFSMKSGGKKKLGEAEEGVNELAKDLVKVEDPLQMAELHKPELPSSPVLAVLGLLAQIESRLSPKNERGPNSPGMSRKKAIKEGVRYWLDAKRYYARYHHELIFDVANSVGDKSFEDDWFRRPDRGMTCELHVDEPNDSARQYLAQEGLNLKTARSVLENLKALYRVLDQILHLGLQARDIIVDPNSKMTQREWNERLEKNAVAHGWDSKEWDESGWPFTLQTMRKPEVGEIYIVDEYILRALVILKKALKRSGGIKSVKTATPKKIQKNP